MDIQTDDNELITMGEEVAAQGSSQEPMLVPEGVFN